MNSVIISFILSFIKNFQLFFENSVFNKIQNRVKRIWLFVTKKSFFVKWFSTYPKTDIEKDSIFLKGLKTIFDTLSKICIFFKNFLLKSLIISKLINWYNDFFTLSIRPYCCGILGFIIPFTIVKIINHATTPFIVTCIGLIIASIIGIYINKSLLSIISNSFIVKIATRFFDYKIPSITETKTASQNSLITHFVIGVIISFFTLLTDSLLIPIAVVGILILFAMFLEFRIGVYLSVILLPFLPTMGIVGMVLLSFVSFILKLLTNKDFKFRKTPLDIPIVIFAVILLFSTLTSCLLGNSIKVFLVYFTFILSYYLITNTFRAKQQIYSVITGMLFVGMLVALYGIYQYVFGFEEGRIWTDNEMFDIKTRVVSTFENPNVLGEYLLLLLPLSIGYIFSKKNLIGKSTNTIATVLLGLCMIFTYSRGNWLGLIIAMALFFMFYDGKIVWWGMLVLFFVPIFLPDTIIDRFLSIGNTNDTSTSYRVNIWYGTCKMLKDYWLTGVGLGNGAFSHIYQHYSYSGIIAPHSHNLYLQLISENGIFGLLCFVAIIFIYYKMCISTIIKTKDKVLKCTITGLSAGMFGYLVQGLFDNVWYNYRIVFMFFVILAITTAIITTTKKEKLEENI